MHRVHLMRCSSSQKITQTDNCPVKDRKSGRRLDDGGPFYAQNIKKGEFS